jgi:hypothetical protein
VKTPILSGFILAASMTLSLGAQDTVNVGAVLKYTGLPSNLTELKNTNLYLQALESQTASETIKLSGVRYIDRVSVDQIFSEKNLSEDMAFNPTSGALRGLLGRLDVLIVIDATDSITARLRAIDLEDGSVRAINTCKRGLFSSPSDGTPDCIKAFVSGLLPITKELSSKKTQRRVEEQQAESQRLAKQASDARAAAAAQKELDAKAKADAEAFRQKQASDARAAAAAQKELDAKAKADAEALRQKQDEDARVLAEKRATIAKLSPDLDDADARLQSANDFWGRMSQSLTAQGRALRSDVQTALRSANTTAQRCNGLSQNLDGDGLKACISDLSGKLDKLDAYK